MELTAIKLSGFKSFVDPTTIRVNGKLVGVVGPNGCGKSNIIDAVRWVLGESRASELRGESMHDVIFNGTTQRKPAGRASVELIFDNTDGRIAGQWGQYGELAVKRVLTREGGSTYFINNVAVRRRDIQDIFLGTGLGPRAYAIIGQGMIARIIEARPEELRTFLEEAAGVSKYRERRRETENRLFDTRENLNRVSDILHELDQSLEKLKVQADLAERYHQLKETQERQQKLLWFLQKKNALKEQSELAFEIEKEQTVLEMLSADMFRHEAELEKLRQIHDFANESVHKAQGDLYQTNSEIGSLEAQIRYVIESRKRLQAQIVSYTEQKDQWTKQIRSFVDEANEGKDNLVELSQHKEMAHELFLQLQEEMPGLENELDILREQAQEMHDHVVQIRQQIAVASTNHKNLTTNLFDCQSRREKLLSQKEQIDVPDMEELAFLHQEKAEAEQQLEELRFMEESQRDLVPELEESCLEIGKRLEECNAVCLQEEARLLALKQIQEKTQGTGKAQGWLEKHGLADFHPLWQDIRIETGWETALESALMERIFARGLSSLDWTESFLKDKPPVKTCFFASDTGNDTNKDEASQPYESLSSRIQYRNDRIRPVLENWLYGVYAIDSMNDALSRRKTLPDGACFILPDGHIIDRHSVRFFAAESESEGVFSRQQEITRLEESHQKHKLLQSRLSEEFRGAESRLKELNSKIQHIHSETNAQVERLHDLQMKILKLEELNRRFTDQSEQIDTALAELDEFRQQREIELAGEEKRLEELDMTLGEWQQKEADFLEAVAGKEEELKVLREKVHQAERSAQQAEYDERALVKRLDELAKQIETAEKQVQMVSGSLNQGQLELQDLDDRVAQENLQVLLDRRMTQEEALARSRQHLDDLAGQLRTLMERRLQTERSLQPQRDKIVAVQLKEQAARINVEQFDEKLLESGADIAALNDMLPENARVSTFQAEIGRLNAEIEGLGPVNLGAAIELNEASNRKKYLEEQFQDLTDAIATLEDAIRRIDRETRSLLKNTFDEVNQSLNELFPVLFGGGHAQLSMTGEEILDAGIQIMAQPPGKKNATIHLLSGGEKALTAIALVFSLFKLNPAPFCLLDEVDAPLDDANTERFSNMVTKMSSQTQFLYISHNRIAMEMAEELVGVTMQEQGVSRIVTVDINDAANFSDEVLRA